MSGFGHTLIMALPPVVRPWRIRVTPKSWDAETIKRLGRDWYYDTHKREYGFSCSDGFVIAYLGRQTHDSTTTQSWCKHLPWTQWRHVRRSLYGLEGEHHWTEPKRSPSYWTDGGHEKCKAAEDSCPFRTFQFDDYDGERLSVRTVIEEREWLLGEGWFKWLSTFCKPKIVRSLDLQFSGETGERKGSWKGGTVGHAITMLPGELHEEAFRRYCDEHRLTSSPP
jgi:hypothetical protein